MRQTSEKKVWKRALFAVLAAFIICGLPAGREAQAQEDPVLVQKVDTEYVSASGKRKPYLEMGIELEGGANPIPEAIHPDYNDNIQVVFSVAFEIGNVRRRRALPRGEKPLIFFRSEALIATLKYRDDVVVYFYIPPEIVEREDLSNKPVAYLVELEVNGKAVPLRRAHVSKEMTAVELVEVFRKEAYAKSSANDGIMSPIYKTIFWAPDAGRKRIARSPAYMIR